MNVALNGLGIQLFGWFGQLSIELAALAVLVLVASCLLPIKSPALRHLLWAVVLIKPLVAIAISSPYTLFTLLVPSVDPNWNSLTFSPVEHPTVRVAASPAIAASSVQLTTAGWGSILWFVGAALLIGRILIGYGIIWCLRQQAQVQHDGLLCDALHQARRTLDCHPKIEVATSPSISSPMVLGILRPIIVFPDDLVEKLSADKLALVLMHELAHVRRWDNLTLLLHRLVSAVLFFHPAVWLCGRMLRREAEQACDDLVVCTTGRSEAYAHGLAHVAERAVHFSSLMRRIPTMNAFAATESDLTLRIRRALGGGARRMGRRMRVLAAVLLCPLAAVTLPSYGNPSEVSKVAVEPSQNDGIWREAMATDPDEWSDELKTQLLALKPNRTIKEIAYAVRQSRDKIWREAMATDPDEWSDELKTQLLALRTQLLGLEPDSTIEEIAYTARQSRLWRQAEETDPDEWSDELKTQLLTLKPGNISYKIATAASDELFIFNVVGELVRTFSLDHQSPGKYSTVWDGRDDAGRERSNGVYFYMLKSDREANKHIGYRTILVR